MSRVWPILRQARITSRRREQLEVDERMVTFLIDQSLLEGKEGRGATEGTVMGFEVV